MLSGARYSVMNNADHEKRADEIVALIASNELDAATKRLMDFVTDFSNNKSHKREVIIIRSRYTELNDEIRLLGKTEDLRNQLTLLRNGILRFLELVEDEYQKNDRPIPSEKDTHKPVIKPKIIVENPKGSNETNKNKTSLEIEKDNFKKSRPRPTQSIDQSLNHLVVFQGKGICKSYKSRSIKFTLSNIDISLKLGEITAVVGENGNGKTTLLRIIAGELTTTTEKLSYPCLTLNNKTDLYSIKQQIAYVPQSLPKWSGLLADNLNFAASIHGITGQDNEDEVDFIISRLGLERYKKATWNEISGGYKMRFALAKTLICNPKLIILDEPLANLDITTQLLFLQDLRDLANSSANPKAIIISSQHLYEVENMTDNIIFMKDGQAIYNGSVVNFGEVRSENSYEIGCHLSKDEIRVILEKFNYKSIEKAGNNFIIKTPRDVKNTELLRVFIENDISLKYFRDISKSTRKLFDRGEL